MIDWKAKSANKARPQTDIHFQKCISFEKLQVPKGDVLFFFFLLQTVNKTAKTQNWLIYLRCKVFENFLQRQKEIC